MTLFRIVCWGGIGDGLRNLSIVPHAEIHRRTGFRYPVVFWKHTPQPIPWAKPFFEKLVARVPSLRWAGEVTNPRDFGRLTYAATIETARLLSGGKRRYYPFEVRLSDDERKPLPRKAAGLTIGVQTHLEGCMQSKDWPLAAWQTFVAGLMRIRSDLRVVIIDKSEVAKALQISENVETTVGFDIAQSIHVVQSLDLLVSVDSWTKYVAAWSGVPQLLVVPDQRGDYPNLTPERLMAKELAGIYDAPGVELMGLTIDGEPRFTFGMMASLSPEDLLERAAGAIARVHAREI